jgi:hypothetical protein
MSYYKMERGWMDSDMFEGAPYDDRVAWAWLIGAARWEDGLVSIKGCPVPLKRGQLSFSLRFLADKFLWSKDRVSRFLDRLVSWGAITIETATGQTIITICNYCSYQDGKDSDKDTLKDRVEDRPKDKEEEYNKYNNTHTHAHAREKSGFQKVYDFGTEVFPRLADRNTSAITRWLADGADAELDIIPEIKRAAGRDIRSWEYFDGGVKDARQRRLSPTPAQAYSAGKKSYGRRMMEAIAKGVDEHRREME